MTTTEQLKHLFSEFPKEDVHWRSKTLSRDKTKALALAYLDARNVMDRLDQIVGAENWQDRYEVHGGRVICYLSIRVDGEWITKADGAGDTQVEGDKGAISDAFKRAGVRWGIGRYLYEIDAPWVPCKVNEKGYWKEWTVDPWNYVGKQPPKAAARETFIQLQTNLRDYCKTRNDARTWWQSDAVQDALENIPADWREELKQEAASLPEPESNGYASQTILSGG